MFLRIKSFAQGVALLALIGGSAQGGIAQSVVSPGNLTAGGGPNSNLYPFSPSSIPNVRSMRYQQVYAASDFASVGGPITIRQIAFRPSEFYGSAFTGNVPDVQINLSTTTKAVDSLSPAFGDNTGADDTIVYNRGALALSSVGNDLGGYYAFDIVITFSTPFTYDPSKGNLLLEVRNFAGSFTTPLDAQRDPADSVSRVYATDVTAAVGVADSLGLATQFTSQILRSLTGTATLESSVNPAQPVTLSLQSLDSSGAPPITVTQTLTSVTGSTGSFSLGGVPAGLYRLKVKGPQWLAASQTIDLTANNVSGLTFLLPAGDANGDNIVDSTDFGLLVGAYGGDVMVDGSGYDPRADFNNDGTVDATDFGLLVGNYGQSGAK